MLGIDQYGTSGFNKIKWCIPPLEVAVAKFTVVNIDITRQGGGLGEKEAYQETRRNSLTIVTY